jgi:hypothetical protein
MNIHNPGAASSVLFDGRASHTTLPKYSLGLVLRSSPVASQVSLQGISERQSEYSCRSVARNTTYKQCSTCRKTLPTFQFNNWSRSKDGLHSSCRACTSRYLRNYSAKHKSKIRKYAREWRQKNPLESKAIHCSDNSNRRAREYGCIGRITTDEVLTVWSNDNYCCHLCANGVALVGRNLTLDHTFPLEFGGENLLSNLRTLCMSHNSLEYHRHKRQLKASLQPQEATHEQPSNRQSGD